MFFLALFWSGGALACRRCVLRSCCPSWVLPSSWRLGGQFGLVLPRHTLLVYACVCGHTTCSFCALGLVVCVFGGGGVLSGGVWLPSLGFVGVLFIPSLLSAWAAH